MRERLAAQASLVVAGAVLISLGTLASRSVWLAAAAMLVVGFAVLFAGVVSSVLAGATTALLVSFILPVTLPGPAASIPDRLAGWLLARSGVARRRRHAVARPVPRAAAAARGTGVRAARPAGAGGGRGRGARRGRRRRGAPHVVLRHAVPPDRAQHRGAHAGPRRRRGDLARHGARRRCRADPPAAPVDPAVWDVCLAAAAVLERAGELLDSADGRPDRLERELRRLEAARPGDGGGARSRAMPSDHDVEALIGSLEPSFRAQEMSFATAAIAANIQLTVAARRRAWWQHVLGRRPAGAPVAAGVGAGARRGPGRAALGVAAEQRARRDRAEPRHLRRRAHRRPALVLGRAGHAGRAALQRAEHRARTRCAALLGTVAGFVIGGGLLLAVGTNTTLLGCCSRRPSRSPGSRPRVSFAAGQAGVHRDPADPVQHPLARRLGDRARADRGRGDRLCRERRGRPAVLAPGRGPGAGAGARREASRTARSSCAARSATA